MKIFLTFVCFVFYYIAIVAQDIVPNISLGENPIEIPYTKDGSSCKIKCQINGLSLNFIYDPRLNDVTISSVDATFMLKNEYLKPSDITSKKNFMNAYGEIIDGTIINLRKVIFGGLELNDIKASVVKKQAAPLLFGKSVFTHLGNVEVDNAGKVLKIIPQRKSDLSISSDSLIFESTEGMQFVEVKSDKEWVIDTISCSWVTLSRNGSRLDIKIDRNLEAEPRSARVVIKSGNIFKRISISQLGSSLVFSELSLSPDNLIFNSSGGTQTINVSTNDSWYIGTAVASWGHLSKNGNDLIIEVEPNKSTDSRKDWFSVKTRSEEKIIKISQEGVSSYLTVSSDKLNFNSLGGTQNISVNSNRDWDISLKTAPWGHLYRNGNVLTVSVDKNENKTQRSDCFKLKADETEVQVNISQEGYSSQEPNSKRTFNQAYDNDDWGISVGYIQKQWEYNLAGNIWKTGPFNDDNKLRGIQAGVRYAPQFWYGIGINTGLFYEYCWEANWITYVNSKSYNRSYKEHGIYIPLHLKYTMNFSEWLQFSLFGGLGLNYIISGKAYLKNDKEYRTWDVFYEDRDWHRLNFMLEYGASIKVKSFQIDISRSKGITNWAGIKDYRLKVGRPLSVSLTYFF